jgi:cellobiose transport system substrate-binding protein
MTLTRRAFLTIAPTALGAATLAATGLSAAGCASPTTASPGRLTLWYSKDGLSETVLAEAVQRFPADRLNLTPIGDGLKHRLLAAMSGGAYLPDLTMLGDDIASYFPDADQFVDLNTVGAGALKSQYLPWKWASGTTADGHMIGFPIDIGPSALYYRHDLFAQAGLPSEPDEVAAAVSTWDDYFRFGQELLRALPGRYLLPDTKMVFTYSMAQQPVKYFDRQNHYLGDQGHVRAAWDRALRAFDLGLTAGYGGAQDQGQSVDRHAAWNAGKELSFVNACWITGELKQAAPSTAGSWRVCRSPGGAGNQGGSYLAITRYCPRPQDAFAVVSWLLSPENQPRAYLDAGLFPSSPAAFQDPRLLEPEPFFGGQATMAVFARSASEVRPAYFSPWDITISDTYTDELTNVEVAGKDPVQAWADAQTAVNRLLRRQGVI